MAHELYVKQPWYYGRPSPILNGIHDGLIEWTKDAVGQFGEVPFGYTEWTLSGHLSIASDRARYLALQDYNVTPKTPQGKKKALKRVRPDLYIRERQRVGGTDCVFEIKSRNVDLGKRKFGASIALNKDWQKLCKYAHDEAKYCCAMVGLTVYGHVGKWEQQCGTQKRYKDSCNKLYENLGKAVLIARLHGTTAPNFYWGYFLNHSYANCEKKFAENKYEPVAVGMLWVGRVQPSPRNS